MQKIIDEVGYIETEISGGYKVKLGKIKVGKPVIKEADGSVRPITPMEARIRDLTYSVPLYLEMTPIIGEGEDAREGETVEVYIGELPVMLGSKICHLYGNQGKNL